MTLAIPPKHRPLLATLLVWILLYSAASLRYPGFFSGEVFLNFFRDNAFLGLCAIGMTFVIISGGIDLSVGAMIGFSSILIATSIETLGLHPALVFPGVLLVGSGFGLGMGTLIQIFRLPPFLVTLAGMFLLRGLGFVVDLETVPIDHTFYRWLGDFSFEVFPVTAVVFLAWLGVAVYFAHGHRGMTPLKIAASRGNLELVQYLLSQGVKIRLQKGQDFTLLNSAAFGGNVEIVKLFLDKGANVHEKDHRGLTPLISAAFGNNLEVGRWCGCSDDSGWRSR